MDMDKDLLRSRYRALSEEELIRLYDAGSLTEVAKSILVEELYDRGFSLHDGVLSPVFHAETSGARDSATRDQEGVKNSVVTGMLYGGIQFIPLGAIILIYGLAKERFRHKRSSGNPGIITALITLSFLIAYGFGISLGYVYGFFYGLLGWLLSHYLQGQLGSVLSLVW
jgi:hypothetical protein